MIILTHNGYIKKGAFSRDVSDKPAHHTIDPKKICPSCKIRERAFDPSGFFRSYCGTCHRRYARESYHRRKNIIPEKKNTALCSKCRIEPKEEPGSRHNSYCTGCRRENKRESYKRNKLKIA